MFNLFKKKNKNEEEKQIQYTLNDIGDVQYFTITDRKIQTKTITAWATYHGLRITFRSGIFVDKYSDELIVEPVIRVQVVDKFESKRDYKYKPTGRPVGRPRKDGKETKYNGKTKYTDICKLLNDGVRIKDIAEKLNVSRSYIHAIKKNINNKL